MVVAIAAGQQPKLTLNPTDAATMLNQVVGKNSTNGFFAGADVINQVLTLSGTPSQVEAAKNWLMQMGENLGGSGSNGLAGGPYSEDRSPRRVLRS